MCVYFNVSNLLLFLVGIITLDHTDAQHYRRYYNDGQDNYKMETAGAVAEDLPVGLSPWELHVVNDLLVEVMLLKCPNVNRTVARGMKTFITAQVSKAPRVETMNSHFFPVYNNLVKCMDYIDAKKMKKVVPEEKAKESESETKSADPSTFDVTFSAEAVTAEAAALEAVTSDDVLVSGEIAGEVAVSKVNPTSSSNVADEEVVQHQASPIKTLNDMIQHEILIIGLTFDDNKSKNEEDKEINANTDESDESHVEIQELPPITEKSAESKDDGDSILESASNLVSKIWNRTKNWFSTNLGRKKRNAEYGNVLRHKGRYGKKPAEGNSQAAARKQVLHKFKQILETLEHVARISCSQKHRPNHSFTIKAIKEMIYWIGQDLPIALDAYEKYFLQGYLGLQVQHCLLNESFE